MKKRKNEKSILREIREWTLHLLLASSLVLLLTSEVFALTEVQGASMENTLKEGDRLYLNKVSYKFSEPEEGDTIVFLKGEVNKGIIDRLSNVVEDIKMNIEKKPRRNRYIKRVIAIPGDKIEIKNRQVYVNDRILEEDYIKGSTSKSTLDYPVIVPEGKLFVMGDNRDNSSDSRMFGLVDYGSVEGKVEYKLWPLGKVGN